MARRVGSASVLKSTSWAFGIGTHNPLTIDLTYNRRDMCESSGNVERHHDPRHKAPPTMWGGPSSAGWRHLGTTWSAIYHTRWLCIMHFRYRSYVVATTW